MWFLVLITLSFDGTVEAYAIDQTQTMSDCFESMENFYVDLEEYDGYLPLGMRAVCIQAI